MLDVLFGSAELLWKLPEANNNKMSKQIHKIRENQWAPNLSLKLTVSSGCRVQQDPLLQATYSKKEQKRFSLFCVIPALTFS